MPLYSYIDDETGEVFDIIQTMSEDHSFFNPSNGNKCRRLWTVPNASVDSVSKINPFDTRGLAEKAGQMKGTMGDMFDMSREASLEREHKSGAEDPVKRKFFKDYERKNKSKHFHDVPSKIETKHATIDFTKPPQDIKLDD
jgi:hypothetical protein